MNRTARAFVFASVVVPAILLVLTWTYWPSLYVMAPAFFPMAGYIQNQTTLLVSAILWFVAISSIFAYLVRARTTAKPVLIYVVLVAASTTAVHAVFLMLGYRYALETP